MYSRRFKLKMLAKFFLNTQHKDFYKKCPFGKDSMSYKLYDHPAYTDIASICCSELCGEFKELGNVTRGCPCYTLGHHGAWTQLRRLLKNEKII